MNTVVSGIVDAFGDQRNDDEINNHERNALTILRFTPKTEDHDVVWEFNKMIESFSGTSEAKPEKKQDADMLNTFAGKSIYDMGRDEALSNKSNFLYITAPYEYSSQFYGHSVTCAILDPRTGEYVGQTLKNFD
eukprot:CAMPEP_0168163322 /NCGR_PEP_ID=MMETSP0139_2-20121125/313_1 /TAXON_ID=44445 /ORGANISM="Pseudo-nitzschia australis, Strain 10249 10 AB" /LENGTH=133 /DNA_ID=CAMNT_0008080207 /DNA_START=286 /DNA_END=687 /DNA_ORIENTATION=-